MKGWFEIISRSKLRVGIGLCVMALGIGSFLSFQRYSIQFTGGVEMVVDNTNVSKNVVDALRTDLVKAGFTPGSVEIGEKQNYASVLVQLKLADDAQVQKVVDVLVKALIENKVIKSADGILEQSIIGPSIGEYMERSALQALIWGLILMAVYILFAFAALRKLISPSLLGLIIILTMIFDIAFPSGMYGLWMHFNSAVQIDAVFVIAVLTVMGYSLNDTVIIFDRIRENYLLREAQYQSGKQSIAELYESSLWQTMRRSIGTSLSTFLVLVSMWVFGTGVLKTFAFTLGMGVISGSFSSIFFAAPLAYLFSRVQAQAKKA